MCVTQAHWSTLGMTKSLQIWNTGFLTGQVQTIGRGALVQEAAVMG